MYKSMALVLSTLIGIGPSTPYGTARSLRARSSHGSVEARIESGLVRDFWAQTSRGRVLGSFLRDPDATVLIARLEGSSERVVVTYAGSSVVLVNVSFGRAGSITYEIDPEREPGVELLSSTVADCGQLQANALFQALEGARSSLREIAATEGAEATLRSNGGALDAALATATLSTSLLSDCATDPGNQQNLFGCWAISPGGSACQGCCNDETAIYAFGVVACGALGPLGPALCGGLVYMSRRECVSRCNEAYPPIPPGPGQNCGVNPTYGSCKTRCEAFEFWNPDYVCGPGLQCCVPTH